MFTKNNSFIGLAALVATFSFSIQTASALPPLQNNSGPSPVFAGPSPDVVVPLDTFNIAVVGFNAAQAGAFIVAPLTATFGMTQTFPGAGLGGQTVTVTSSESFSGGNTIDTITISVPTNFLPAGTTIGGTPVTVLEMDLGGFNAGTNTLDFLTPVTGGAFTGSMLFSGGTFTLTPTVQLTNGNMSLAAAEGVNAGGGDLSPFAIRSFTFTATYATVPEPSSVGLGAAGVIALLLLRNVFRRRARS